ncbi:lactonase family protein [Microbacterium karelineae]|uniref:lactonase family protein n=1 Tax=Microbacterium karelineae TaxID=2654283 RepID=UPI0012EAB793|nr:beta-propeller fold lactonase family protein [Microbacterium karelineae]
MRFWIGARGADMGASATGIGAVSSGDDGTLVSEGVAALAPSPTWLAPHPRLDVVYAALEKAGQVAAFARVGEAALEQIGGTVVAGDATCHLAVAPDGSGLVASCWGDGRVVYVPLAADGALGLPGLAPAAEDPYDVGGRPTRAHSAAFLPDGRVATTDLGFDLVRIWGVGSGRLLPDHEVVLPQGSGPRHMVMHDSGRLFVVTEFSCEVVTLAEGGDGLWGVFSTVDTGAADGDTGAELAASPDGRILYAGLRGSDRIAVLRVDPEVIVPIALVDAGVKVPRHHVVAEGRLLVAGQRSDEIVALEIDEATGIPGAVVARLDTPTPQHIRPVG